jgi:uncharacterized GH25 family protein
MDKAGKLAILAVLLVVLGALGVFFLDPGNAKAPIAPPAAGLAETAPPPAELVRGESGARGTPTEAHGARVAMDLPEPETGLPESYRETLVGFRGRVVHHDATPAPDHRVLLYRFDLQSVIGADVSLFSEALFRPDLDAGDTRTDAEGRFEIRGVFPRGFFLVHAGVGSANPTAKIVQRSPGPGEMVDLGDIVLKNGAVLTGQVVDPDGKPIAGALVRATDIPGQALSFVPLERFDPQGAVIITQGDRTVVMEMPEWAKLRFDQLPIAKATTGDDGRFRITGVDPGDNAVLVTATGRNSHVNPRVKLAPGEERDLGQIDLDAGEEVYGRVVDEQGKPIAGAEVLIGQGTALAPVALASHHGPSDAKGEFSATGFKAGKVVGAARRSARDPWVVSEPQPAGRDLVITLASRHSLTLRLTSSAGLAIGEPQLRLIPGRAEQGAVDMGLWGLRRNVQLAERLKKLDDARVRIEDLDRGHYTLLVRATGHGTAMVDIELNGDIEQAVQLHAQKVFEVVVTDARNAPVADAAVYVQAQGPHPRVPNLPLHCGVTDKKGRLQVDQAASDELSISAAHPKWGRVHDRITLPQREVRLRFEDPGSLEGTLTENGAVPELGKWTILIEPRHGGAAVPQLPRFALPDASGQFQAAGLEPGEYVIVPTHSLDAVASPGGLVQTMFQARFAAQNDTRVQITANAVARVTLDTVKPPESVDGPSAQITGTAMINGRPAVGMVVTGWGGRRVMATVADNGTFDAGRVKQGHVNLQLMDPNNQSLGQRQLWSKSMQVKADENIVVDIDLNLGSLSGTVHLVDGSPAAGIEVSVRGALTERTAPKNPGQQASSHFQQLTDDRGQFEFTDIPAAIYSVNVRDKRGHAEVTGIEVLAGSGRRGVEVRMQRVFTVRGSVDLAAMGKEPFEWAWMQLNPESGNRSNQSWVAVEKDGRFEAETLRTGRYSVELQFMVRKAGEENRFDNRQFVADPIEVVDRDLDGLMIHPRTKPPPPPQPPAKKPDKK